MKFDFRGLNGNKKSNLINDGSAQCLCSVRYTARLYSIKIQFYSKKSKIAFWPPFGDLGAAYALVSLQPATGVLHMEAVDIIISTALKVIKFIFAVYMCHSTMGLTRCYKTAVFLHL